MRILKKGIPLLCLLPIQFWIVPDLHGISMRKRENAEKISIKHGVPSKTHLMGILHIHLMSVVGKSTYSALKPGLHTSYPGGNAVEYTHRGYFLKNGWSPVYFDTKHITFLRPFWIANFFNLKQVSFCVRHSSFNDLFVRVYIDIILLQFILTPPLIWRYNYLIYILLLLCILQSAYTCINATKSTIHLYPLITIETRGMQVFRHNIMETRGTHVPGICLKRKNE